MKANAIALFLCFALLISCAVPSAKYTVNLTVQVFDQWFRPVQGAQAYVEYELNPVKGNINTKPKLTDSNGNANIIFTNYDEIESSTNYAYTIHVSYGGQLASASLIAENGEKRVYTMQVESFLATVLAVDQKGKPLDASIEAGGQVKNTSEDGIAVFQLPTGNYTVHVERGDLVRNIPLYLGNSTGDRSVEAVLSYYSLAIHAKDDNGLPLQVQAEVNGALGNTDASGDDVFENISTDSPQVILTYGQFIKRLTPDLKAQKSMDVVFDLSKPEIKEQYSTVSPSGAGTVRFFVTDPGPHSSGIDTVSVSYEVAGIQNKLSVYAIGYNSFEAKIPTQPPGTSIKYTIEVADKDGNAEVGYGTYAVPRAGSNATGNGTLPPQPPGPQPSSIPTEMIVGAAALALVAFAGIYYYNKRKESQASPPTAPPPAAPPSEPPPVQQ